MSRSHQRKLLVVEDDRDSRELLTELLQCEFPELQVAAVESAEDALTLVQADPSLFAVITDQTLPGMTGVELARELKARLDPPVVVLVSGHAQVEGSEGCCDATLAKPLDIEQLSTFLRGHRARGGEFVEPAHPM